MMMKRNKSARFQAEEKDFVTIIKIISKIYKITTCVRVSLHS